MSERWDLMRGDCRELLKTLPDACLDSCVTDPPYELGFMGKRWDSSGVAFDVATWAEVFRVLKPGGHLLAFGGTRTYHRMTCAIEDAGFDIRDSLHWLYGSGFPKSLNIGKEIAGQVLAGYTDSVQASDAWEGWGTALKPSHEPIVLARKPLGQTVAANVLEHGTGGLNIDATRVGDEGGGGTCSNRAPDGTCQGHQVNSLNTTFHAKLEMRPVFTTRNDPAVNAYGDGLSGSNRTGESTSQGRWPPNTIFTHDPECRPRTCADGCPVAALDAQTGVTKSGDPRPDRGKGGIWRAGDGQAPAGPQYGDEGGASRFFPCFRYTAKPNGKERDLGLAHLPKASAGDLCDREDDSIGANNPRAGTRARTGRANIHPTVKPIELMRWLVRLVTPPGGVVLDPFVGSGTTAVAALLEGFNFLGCELTDTYVPIIEGRVTHALAHPEDFEPKKGKKR